MADAKMKVSQMGAVLAMDDDDLINVVTYNDQNQTYVSGKATGAKVKEYMVGDNDISALGDGSVTGAILNVKSTSETADSNIAETMAQNGAHNLLCHDLVSEVRSGVTMTVNANRSITLSNSNTSGEPILFIASFLINIEAGKTYKMLLDPATGTIPLVYTETTELYYRDGDTFTASVNERAKFMLRIEDSFTTSSPVTIKPMMTLASDPSTTYTPHAMTNGELTEKCGVFEDLSSHLSTFTGNFTLSNAYAYRQGKHIHIEALGVATGSIVTSDSILHMDKFFESADATTIVGSVSINGHFYGASALIANVNQSSTSFSQGATSSVSANDVVCFIIDFIAK